MAIAKLTAHRIRHWPKEQVKVLVDSREQHPWDLSPMHLEAATLANGDYAQFLWTLPAGAQEQR